MIELHLPWLELAVLLPIVGAIVTSFVRRADSARWTSVLFAGATLLCTVGAWQDFRSLQRFEAHDRWDVLSLVLHRNLLVIDELSAPLLPLGALVYFLTILATPRTKATRFSFSSALVSEAILLATLCSRGPWGLVTLLIVGLVPPYLELCRRQQSTRIYVLHATLFTGLLVAGQGLVSLTTDGTLLRLLGVVLLTGAVLVRNGVVPVHCWLTDLFERASFGRALLFVTPLLGAYGVMRLVLPVAPGWALHTISVLSLVTALYAGGMALVQTDSRRFFAFLFLSHSSLVLVGLELATPVGMTGALCVWVSVGLSLTGFGLTLRCIEARTGRLRLDRFHGLYDKTPMLAGFFLLTGLASIGFPGTLGFVGAELLVVGAIDVAPWVGVLVVFTGALNGLAVMQVYLRVFTGCRHPSMVDLSIRPGERLAVLTLTVLILGGGLYPQPGVAARYHAAVELANVRRRLAGEEPAAPVMQSPVGKVSSRASVEPVGVRPPLAVSPLTESRP